MGLKLAGARLFMKGGLLNRSIYIGAMSSATAEFTDTWHQRQRLQLSNWTRTNAGLAENTAALNFPSPTANALLAPRFWGGWTASSSGTLLVTNALSGTPAAPALGANFGFDAGQLELAHSTGAITARGMRRGYESGLVSGTTYLGLFERQPSQSSPGPIDDRVGISAAGWVENPGARNYVRNSATVDFGIQVTDVPVTPWLGLFDASTGGNLLWEDQFDTTPADPQVGARLSIPANMVGVGITIDT